MNRPAQSLSAALPLLLLLSLAACKPQSAPPQAGAGGGAGMPPPEVEVMTVEPRNVPRTLDAPGRLQAVRTAEVRARVEGILERRTYSEGSEVKAGAVLFRIDGRTLAANVEAAKASLARSQAQKLIAGQNRDRMQALVASNAVSKQEFDQAMAAKAQANADVAAAQAALAKTEIDLSYATVTAPISGRIGRAQVTEGALVGEGAATLLTTVDQIAPLYVDFSVSAEELAAARRASDGSGSRDVQVILPDGSAYSRPGTLDFTADVVDPSTGAVALRARLPNPEHQLLPGTFVKLRATLSEQREAYRIPQTAVQRDAQGAFVFVVDQAGKAQRKDIDASVMDGSDWIVSSGVAPGDRVIVSGVQRVMQPGQPVTAKPVQADAAKAAPGPAPKQG